MKKRKQLDLTNHKIWKDRNIKPEAKEIYAYLYSEGFDKTNGFKRCPTADAPIPWWAATHRRGKTTRRPLAQFIWYYDITGVAVRQSCAKRIAVLVLIPLAFVADRKPRRSPDEASSVLSRHYFLDWRG